MRDEGWGMKDDPEVSLAKRYLARDKEVLHERQQFIVVPEA